MRSTVAGENSLEAVLCTRLAGFAAIETDVRLTKDGHLIVMHDETLNRTCLNLDGTVLRDPVQVARLTYAELKMRYRLKATEADHRTPVPSLEEFLAECSRNRLLTFIHPKLDDESGRFYRQIIQLADKILGRDNYVVTSNNRANQIIRTLGLSDGSLMGILHETTFEEIADLKNTIMAISATRYSPSDYAANVAHAQSAHIRVESSADDFAHLAIVDANHVDFVSTDFLAPDPSSSGRLIHEWSRLDDFRLNENAAVNLGALGSGDFITLRDPAPLVHFGAVYLELKARGKAVVRLGRQEFAIDGTSVATVRHQVLLYDLSPEFRISAGEAFALEGVVIRLVAFDR